VSLKRILYPNVDGLGCGGFFEIVARADLTGFHRVGDTPVCGQHDDYLLGVLIHQMTEGLQPIHFRHPDVEQHGIEGLLLADLQRLLSAVRDRDRVALEFQADLETLPQVRLSSTINSWRLDILASKNSTAETQRSQRIKGTQHDGCFGFTTDGRPASSLPRAAQH